MVQTPRREPRSENNDVNEDKIKENYVKCICKNRQYQKRTKVGVGGGVGNMHAGNRGAAGKTMHAGGGNGGECY